MLSFEVFAFFTMVMLVVTRPGLLYMRLNMFIVYSCMKSGLGLEFGIGILDNADVKHILLNGFLELFILDLKRGLWLVGCGGGFFGRCSFIIFRLAVFRLNNFGLSYDL